MKMKRLRTRLSILIGAPPLFFQAAVCASPVFSSHSGKTSNIPTIASMELQSQDPEEWAAALRAESALRAFLREHPRWMEEESGPARMRHLRDQTLDAYLRIVWRGQTKPEIAVRALWQAHQCALLCGEQKRARDFAQDITRSHPDTPYAHEAFRFLKDSPEQNPNALPSKPPAPSGPRGSVASPERLRQRSSSP